MSQPDLSVVIVSWNVREHLARCLAALQAAIGSDLTWDVIVVDNASTDGSADLVRTAFSQVQLIANPGNELYTAAVNRGLALARGRHLLLLNPDTLPQPKSLARMVDYAHQHADAGLIGPRIFHPDGGDDLLTGRHYPTPGSEFLVWLGLTRWFPRSRLWAANLRPHISRALTGPVPLLSGACLLLPAHLPAHLRRLDACFPMYGEDVDLCRRVQAHGYRAVLVAEAHVVHQGGASSRQAQVRTAFLAVEGAQRYFRRWLGAGAARRHRLGMAIVAVSKWLAFSLMNLVRRDVWSQQQRRLYATLLRWALSRRKQDGICQQQVKPAAFTSPLETGPDRLQPQGRRQ